MPSPTAGKDWLAEIENPGAPGTYNVIAAQRGGNIQIEAEGIDVSSKDDNGWADTIPGPRRWRSNLDGLYVESDAALDDIKDAINNETSVNLRITRPDGKVFLGAATVTSFEHNFANGDAAQYTAVLEGKGAPTKWWEV